MVLKKLSYLAVSVCLLWGCSKASFPWETSNSSGTPYGTEDYSAIVTVKQDDSGAIVLQLDDYTRLYPSNYTHPYNGLQRIICGLRIAQNNRCEVLWMDFLEKGGVSGNWSGEGDGADVLDDWMTGVEDGFLTLHYSAFWGSGEVEHGLSIVTGRNPNDPYELWFCHDSKGDTPLTKADALVYFDINTLPPTDGKYVTLTLKWLSSASEPATKTFRFKSRQ